MQKKRYITYSKMGSIFLVSVLIILVANKAWQAQASEIQDFLSCRDDERLENLPECPAKDDQFPVYFPFPGDCTKFFECTNGIAQCLKCPSGTTWDSDLNVCNYESEINCQDLTSTTQNFYPEPIGNESRIFCPPGYYGFIKHEFNCALFYQCTPGGIPCLMKCSVSLYWNPDLCICDWPANVPSCPGGTHRPPIPSLSNYRNFRRLVVNVTAVEGQDQSCSQLPAIEHSPDICRDDLHVNVL